MPTSLPKVSVIVPCFNYGRYLSQCLDSLLNQTYKNIEIIVVDDESTDNTKEVALGYASKGVKYIWQKNKGLAGTRNTGIKEATGEYVVCIDADDLFLPGAIETKVSLMDNDMAIGVTALMEFEERHIIMIPVEGANLESVMQSNCITCDSIFSKRMWELVGGYDESETIRLGYEDWLFWIELLAQGCHVNTSDTIALRYRCHQGQMTQATSWPNRQKLYNYIYKKHKALYDSKGLTVAGMIKQND